MKLSRATTGKLRFILDDLLPPILRDSKVLMYLPLRMVFKHQAKLVMQFKQQAPSMTDREIEQVYNQVEWYMDQRETDANEKCIEKLIQSTVGKTVIDVGCGRGLLANKLVEKGLSVTGVDIVISGATRRQNPSVIFRKATIEKLPFPARAFDTVVSTHTLEHVRQLEPAIRELRRVTKKRLIIVVPKQRPYKYTFDLHLQFFPTTYSLLQVMGGRGTCADIQGDLFYIEDMRA